MNDFWKNVCKIDKCIDATLTMKTYFWCGQNTILHFFLLCISHYSYFVKIAVTWKNRKLKKRGGGAENLIKEIMMRFRVCILLNRGKILQFKILPGAYICLYCMRLVGFCLFSVHASELEFTVHGHCIHHE